MNVRGDQHLNFTPEEAAAWLGRMEVRHRAPRANVNHHARPAHENDDAVAGGIGVMAVFVVLAIVGVAIYGSTQRQPASDAARASVQPRTAVTQVTATADTRRQEVIAENVSLPTAAAGGSPSTGNHSQDSPSPVAYLPPGWFYGRLRGDLPLRSKEGRSLGALPDGTVFFGTTATSPVEIVVTADGDYWGFGELKPPENAPAPPIPITPAFEKAAAVIGNIEAFGVAEALHVYSRQEPEDAYLPGGWSMGDLCQDQPLTDRIDGTRIGTIKRGTRLLYRIANVNDWRLVVSADGSLHGYACIRSLAGAPERTPMRPECRGGVALIHRLQGGPEPGGTRRAFAENLAAPSPDGGEEQ
jgi:hypothetical protein